MAYALVRPLPADPSAIVISSDRIGAIVGRFRATWQRSPSREELNALIESFVREEVFYREGLALGLDRDDVVVRNRVKQKMELLSEDSSAAAPSEADLQKYLDEHRDDFVTPAAMPFEQVYFDPDRHRERLDRDARQSLVALRAGGDALTYGDSTLLPRHVERAFPADIKEAFGDAFEQVVRDLPPGTWSGPLRSSFGYHLVRVVWKGARSVPTLADAHGVVLREWTRAHTVDVGERLYRSLRARYTVTVAAGQVAAIAADRP